MERPLKVIILFDAEDDLLHILKRLEELPFQIGYKHVVTEQDFVSTLAQGPWDLVICDYILAGFSAFKALDILKNNKISIPFVIVSERIGEENAILAIKSGADDYVLKDNLSRLPVVIERSVHEHRKRQSIRERAAGSDSDSKEMKQIIENADEAIFIEQNNTLKLFNRRAKEIFAVDHFPVENFSLQNFILPDSPAEMNLPGQGGYQIRKLRTAAEEQKWLEIREFTIDWKGTPAKLIFARDISARKNLENRLQAAQRLEAIGTLAGGIAHDFNNILSPILGYTELALEDIDPDSLTYKNLAQVYKAANRAKELVQQILTFSRQSDTRAKPLKIQVIAKETMKFLRASIPSSVQFNLQIDNECRPVMADPTQIHQLILNLCSNAYQAMSKQQGILGIRLTEKEISPSDPLLSSGIPADRYVQLSISDNGQGMDPATLQRIFEPFFTTKEKGTSAGMGLAVVHGIIKDHKGFIDVHSKPGQGTIFDVYLPLIREAGVQMNLPSLQSPPPAGGSILLVDDEKDIVFLLRQMLEGLGYQVTARTSSLEALQAFENQPDKYDLVITDQSMPNMTGEELARRLTGIRPQLPVLLCTGFSDSRDQAQLHATGIVGIILKPVLKNDLANTVSKILEKNK